MCYVFTNIYIQYCEVNIFLTFQLGIQVQDGGNPPQRETGIVTVNMLRNLNAPKFDNENYERTILETLAVGGEVIEIIARDNDGKVGDDF